MNINDDYIFIKYQAKGNIEKYSEELEKKILEKFDKVYKENDIDKMSVCIIIHF